MVWTLLKKLKIISKCRLSAIPLPSHILSYETNMAMARFVKWIKFHLQSHLSQSCMYFFNLM